MEESQEKLSLEEVEGSAGGGMVKITLNGKFDMKKIEIDKSLIVADEGSFVNYLEGCTAPQRDENQLHSAIVELVALDNAEIKYSTVQNWYTGDKNGQGGIYNFVTKRETL
jgi:Fe-S cluster assembly scaffold protein SufB